MPKTRTRPAGEPETEESDDGAGGDGARGDGARGGDAALTRGDVESIVSEMVPRLVDELLGDDDGDGAGDAGSGDGGGGDGGGNSSPAAVEHSIAGEVARELERIRTADQVREMREELTNVRETVEKVPAKASRVSRFFWGSEPE